MEENFRPWYQGLPRKFLIRLTDVARAWWARTCMQGCFAAITDALQMVKVVFGKILTSFVQNSTPMPDPHPRTERTQKITKESMRDCTEFALSGLVSQSTFSCFPASLNRPSCPGGIWFLHPGRFELLSVLNVLQTFQLCLAHRTPLLSQCYARPPHRATNNHRDRQ